jgi:hypothetical protein
MRSILFLAAALPCSVLACGGDVALPLDGGGVDGSSSDGASDGSLTGDAPTLKDGGGVVPTSCPSTPPIQGMACGTVGETCEYGSAWWLHCDTVVKCGTDHLWMPTELGTGSCPGEGAPSCPATYASALGAGECAGPADCDYPQGHCTCLGYCGGPPPPGPVPSTFHCSAAPSGCPVPRPRAGTACATEGKTCEYMLGCCGGTVLQCTSGEWQAQQPPICN